MNTKNINNRYGLLLILLIVPLAACTTTEIDEFRQGATNISANEKIVILGRRQNNNYETEGSFVQCVANIVSSGSDGIEVIAEQDFLDAGNEDVNIRQRSC